MWTQSARAFVRERWMAGDSARQISCGLRGFGLHKTRNAIIGVIHRKGWQRNAAPNKGRVEKVKRAIKATARARGLVPALTPLGDPSLSVERLQAGQCRWPIGDPKEPDFAFCDHPVEPGRPYCAHHCHVAYQPNTQQERKKRDTSRRGETACADV